MRSNSASRSASVALLAGVRVVVLDDAPRTLVERDRRAELGHERGHLAVVEQHRVRLVAERASDRGRGRMRRWSRTRHGRSPAAARPRHPRASRRSGSSVGACDPVIVNASPIASGLPSRPVKATAKSSAWVIVHRLVPSPWMTTGRPARIRAMSVQPPIVGIIRSSYVCEGRTIVTGSPRSRCAATSRSSHAILSREYCQNGLRSGVDSVTGSRRGGFSYADAELMNTYCPVRPSNSRDPAARARA